MNEDSKLNLRRTIKKRIMFSKNDDYYFIVYNTLIFLNTNNFDTLEHKFQDYRKLAYIVPFISNNFLLEMLDNCVLKGCYSSIDINLLQNIYYNTRFNLKTFTAIILAMENKGLVHLLKDPKRSCVDIWIDKEKIPKTFLMNELFNIDANNTILFNKIIPRNRTLTLKTLLKKLFEENGVLIWDLSL